MRKMEEAWGRERRSRCDFIARWPKSGLEKLRSRSQWVFVAVRNGERWNHDPTLAHGVRRSGMRCVFSRYRVGRLGLYRSWVPVKLRSRPVSHGTLSRPYTRLSYCEWRALCSATLVGHRFRVFLVFSAKRAAISGPSTSSIDLRHWRAKRFESCPDLHPSPPANIVQSIASDIG